MPPVCVPTTGTHPPYTKSAGYAPLPGYTLIEPLGRGGFGEVWKCEAPGGLHKAIKFVAGDSDAITNDSAQLRQEYEAFQQVKAIRHPFLLSLERVELVDGELVMVMELADRQLGDRFVECRDGGLPGIPREELLGYLREAAEALDMIGDKYGLQHLDVKPANLFLTAGHVQVGDYGLVSKLDAGKKGAENRGLTPRYAAPEVLCGQVHTRSDQYSLALVYHELVSGTFPYNGRSSQQLMMQHISAVPDLTGLPESDRATVATALAKQPDERFASCAEFIRALTGTRPRSTASLVASLLMPASRVSGLVAPAPEGGGVFDATSGAESPTHGPGNADETTRQNVPSFVTPGPRLAPPRHAAQPVPRDVLTPAPVEQMVGKPVSPGAIKLARIVSVVPVAWLQGHPAALPDRPPSHLVGTILRAAEADSGLKAALGAVNREDDGTWGCRFLTTIDPRVAQVKLDLLWEEGGVAMDTRTAGRVVFRKIADAPAATGWFSTKKTKTPDSGLEVVVELPDPSRGTAEVAVRGKLFGNPPPDFAKSGEKLIVKLLEGIRRTLNNVEERRKHPRLPATFPLTLYPFHSDGRVDAPIQALCQDVSAGGMAMFCPVKPSAKYVYVVVEGVSGAASLAVLLQITRSEWQHDEVLVTGRYRLDIGPKS